MAHLSPKKGGFPFKDQHDRTCVVAADEANKAIERGSVVRVNKDGQFELAADTSVQPLYLALQNYNDLQANMAGFFGLGVGPTNVPPAEPTAYGGVKDVFGKAPAVGPKGPAITGIHMDDGDVWQTDMFDEDADYEIGDPVTVKDGIITTAGADDTNTVGYVTAVPYTRWANDAVAAPGLMTGAMIRVLDFQCGK